MAKLTDTQVLNYSPITGPNHVHILGVPVKSLCLLLCPSLPSMDCIDCSEGDRGMKALSLFRPPRPSVSSSRAKVPTWGRRY